MLSDSRPPTSHGEGEAGVDDDHSGGISLADYQQYVQATSSTHAMDEGDSMAVQVQSAMAQNQTSYLPFLTAALDHANMPYHFSTAHVPGPPVLMSHLSSSGSSLEPPPTLQEAHLSIHDRGSFAPITTFFHYFTPQKPTVPGLDLIEVPRSITRDDLQGDSYDCQGIDWSVRNITRSAMRTKRFEYESEKLPPCLKEVRKCIPPTPNTDNFFQFRRNNTTPRAFFPHFQLRNVLAATSRNDIYYAAGHKVFRTDAEGTPADVIVDLSKRLAPDGSITTIASTDNVLIAGAFEGEYAITNLSSTYGSPCTFGRTTDFAADTKSRIVNHMHLFESRRTYSPQAVLCSNDHRLQILDCATNTFTHSYLYPAAVNCAATSPNGRMRVVVGDFQETLITNAETGKPFETLNSHTDDAFACAWADDGIHVATAAQDSTIVIWDARYWEKPLTVITSELSVPRSLHFSPVGSGPRVLVAAEADDYINVINAQSFESKQVFDFFGPIGGATFTPDGQSLFIANGERRFGGIIELERTGWAERNSRQPSRDNAEWNDTMTDWAHDNALNDHERVIGGDVERRRRNVDLSQLVI
ncbi:WD40 repeat-like protein [Clathrospora elynae]|uniref:WD40 repeat-like protein n=1 Tax=Clathrospora elynae TaxID=706981 RepID=A0A6A5T646_9PLEO|nr:WD40 repeat-like protein [Clathrospora elynae]